MKTFYPEVRLVEYTPHPERLICLTARGDYSEDFVWDTKFGKAMEGIKGKTVEEKEKTLILKLMKRRHFGPFEHVSMTFGIKGMSRSCMAQLTRHRIASFDIQSLRYVKIELVDFYEAFHWPESFFATEVKSREGKKKLTCDPEKRCNMIAGLYHHMTSVYNALVSEGMPKEDARMVLPLSTRVNGTMTTNARSLMHIIDMRLAGDAQGEIRRLSEGFLREAKIVMPTTFGYYESDLLMRKNRLAP